MTVIKVQGSIEFDKGRIRIATRFFDASELTMEDVKDLLDPDWSWNQPVILIGMTFVPQDVFTNIIT